MWGAGIFITLVISARTFGAGSAETACEQTFSTDKERNAKLLDACYAAEGKRKDSCDDLGHLKNAAELCKQWELGEKADNLSECQKNPHCAASHIARNLYTKSFFEYGEKDFQTELASIHDPWAKKMIYAELTRVWARSEGAWQGMTRIYAYKNRPDFFTHFYEHSDREYNCAYFVGYTSYEHKHFDKSWGVMLQRADLAKKYEVDYLIHTTSINGFISQAKDGTLNVAGARFGPFKFIEAIDEDRTTHQGLYYGPVVMVFKTSLLDDPKVTYHWSIDHNFGSFVVRSLSKCSSPSQFEQFLKDRKDVQNIPRLANNEIVLYDPVPLKSYLVAVMLAANSDQFDEVKKAAEQYLPGVPFIEHENDLSIEGHLEKWEQSKKKP